MPTVEIDMRGRVFGRWTVLDRPAELLPGGMSRWWCRCECGRVKTVRGNSLRRGESLACRQCGGHYTHGKYRSPTYNSWAGMAQRCGNLKSPNYRQYGARGIRVCGRWLGPGGFENFLADMGERPGGPQGSPDHHSLDRIDNDGNYEPGNCRWAIPKEQAENRRKRRRKTDDER